MTVLILTFNFNMRILLLILWGFYFSYLILILMLCPTNLFSIPPSPIAPPESWISKELWRPRMGGTMTEKEGRGEKSYTRVYSKTLYKEKWNTISTIRTMKNRACQTFPGISSKGKGIRTFSDQHVRLSVLQADKYNVLVLLLSVEVMKRPRGRFAKN